MMSKHINKKDLIDFVFSNQADNIDIERISRINKHLYECDKCKENYYHFLSLLRILEKTKRNNFQAVAFGGLFAHNHNINQMKDVISRLKEEVELTVFSNDKIEIKNPILYLEFNHPNLQNPIIAKSIYSTQVIETEEQIIESILVSTDESLRISIDEDSTLCVYYAKDISTENDIIMLIENDKEKIYLSNIEQYDQKANVARFSELEPGNYLMLKTSL